METSARVNVDLFSIKFSVTLITASMAPIHFINPSGSCVETFLKREMLFFILFLPFLFSFKPKHFTAMELYFIAFLSFFCGISDTECPKCIPNFSAKRIEISMVCVSHVSKQLKCSKLMHNSSCN